MHRDLRYSSMVQRYKGSNPEPSCVESLRKKLMEVQAEVKKLRVNKTNPGSENILGDFCAPLVKKVKRASLLRKFSIPYLESYQGQTDPITT